MVRSLSIASNHPGKSERSLIIPMNVLGLFPLHIVLFPEAYYPLHIFEERYKKLVKETVETESEFGINLVEGGKMFEVGCRVKVSRILKELPDGRKDIVVIGTTRYRVEKIRPAEMHYITADVIDYDDLDETIDLTVIDETIVLYNELIERVYGAAEEKLNVEEWMGRHPSYRIAQKSGLDLMLRQRLLEMRSENERLSFLRSHLRTILPKIRRVDQIRMLSRNDGYLPS